jgi:hypothetical protein
LACPQSKQMLPAAATEAPTIPAADYIEET